MFLGYEKTKIMRAFCKHESSAVKETENTGRIQSNKTHALGLVSSFFYWWLGVENRLSSYLRFDPMHLERLKASSRFKIDSPCCCNDLLAMTEASPSSLTLAEDGLSRTGVCGMTPAMVFPDGGADGPVCLSVSTTLRHQLQSDNSNTNQRFC